MFIETPDAEMDELENMGDDVGSYNHGYVQGRLIISLDRTEKYTPISELSLDVSSIDLSQYDLKTKEEIKPDISLYPKRGIYRPTDILKMREMPLAAIEVLSPKQGVYDIVEKFKVYFDLGIKSCWLVEPITSTVTVYSAIDHNRAFGSGNIEDKTLGIQLPLMEIFA